MPGPGKPVALARATAGLLGGLCCVSLVWSHGTEEGHENRLERLIPPADSYELCLDLAQDQQLHYAFSATRKLDFNIHYHAGPEVRYPVSDKQVSAAEATFAAQSAQKYCLMWTNPGDTEARLSIEYEKPPAPGR